jgi:hypothetical protein
MDEHRDTVVVEDGRGSGTGVILGVIAIVVLLIAVWYFALGPGGGSSTTNNNTTIDNGGNNPVPSLQVPASS